MDVWRGSAEELFQRHFFLFADLMQRPGEDETFLFQNHVGVKGVLGRVLVDTFFVTWGEKFDIGVGVADDLTELGIGDEYSFELVFEFKANKVNNIEN